MPVVGGVAVGLAVVGTAIAVTAQMRAAKDAALAQEAQGARGERQAESAARLKDRDVLLAEQEAAQEAQAIEVDVDTLRRQFRRLQGKQIATTGARGIELQGSPLEILAETAAESEFEIERVRFQSEETQRALADEAAQSRFEADELRLAGLDAIAVSRSRARASRRTGTLAAIGTGLQGAGQVAAAGSGLLSGGGGAGGAGRTSGVLGSGGEA